MKILGIIPARGGSKRLPGKNIRPLGSRPLIAWTLEAAKQSGVLDTILVSTDDADIANIATEWGGYVPWLRPPELATDTSSSMDVILHALDWFELTHNCVDGVMLLQPTSPFRSSDTIRTAVAVFNSNGQKPIVSINSACVHPAWCFTVEHNLIIPVLNWNTIQTRSQDLPDTYELNGSIYMATPAFLRKYSTFITPETYPLIMNNREESLDIDTSWDWQLAEAIINIRDNKTT